jgi:hypothetical protein
MNTILICNCCSQIFELCHNDTQINYVASSDIIVIAINWNGHGWKWSWANLRYHPDVCAEGLKKTKVTIDDLGPGVVPGTFYSAVSFGATSYRHKVCKLTDVHKDTALLADTVLLTTWRAGAIF